MSEHTACDDCGETVSNALARTVRLTVDRSQVDSQRLCPNCFADWVNRYEEEMRPAESSVVVEDDEDIIID